MERVLQSILFPHSAFPDAGSRTAWIAKGGHTAKSTHDVLTVGLPDYTGPATVVTIVPILAVDPADEGEFVDLGDGVTGLKFKMRPEPDPATPVSGDPVEKCMVPATVAAKYYEGYSDRPHGANCLEKMANCCKDHYKTVEHPEVAKFLKETGVRCKSMAKAHYASTDLHKQMPDDWDEPAVSGDPVQKSPAVAKSIDGTNVVAKGFAVDVDQLRKLNEVADRLSGQLKAVTG